MSKILEIRLIDPTANDHESNDRSYEYNQYMASKLVIDDDICLSRGECPGILRNGNKVINSGVTVAEAIDAIISYFVKRHIYALTIDIAERERLITPPKEMTLEEIEKALGYRIVIKED